MSDRKREHVPFPPLGPAEHRTDDRVQTQAFWPFRRLPAELAGRWDQAYELYEQSIHGREGIDRVAMLRRSVELHPVSKTAQMLSRELARRGDTVEAMAWAGLAYALKPRHDQAATHLAKLLAEGGQPERAWEIVAEILTRNKDYGPAWKLLEELEGMRSTVAWAHETIEELKGVAPSVEVAGGAWGELHGALCDRFPMGGHGIDWTKANPLTESEVGSPDSARAFVTQAIAQLELSEGGRVLLVADHVFDEVLSLQVSDMASCTEKLVLLPLGFLYGPVNGRWDWVIDVRFSGYAWAGRSAEVTR